MVDISKWIKSGLNVETISFLKDQVDESGGNEVFSVSIEPFRAMV